MANCKASTREQDTLLFCGSVIKNVRDQKTFSFQTLYTESTGKKNPNKAYKLRDALVGTGIIKARHDGTYCLSKKEYDPLEVLHVVTDYLKKAKDAVNETHPEPVQEVKEEAIDPQLQLFMDMADLFKRAKQQGIKLSINISND